MEEVEGAHRVTVHSITDMRSRQAVRRRDLVRTGYAIRNLLARHSMYRTDTDEVSKLVKMACELRLWAVDKELAAHARDTAARGARILAEMAYAVHSDNQNAVNELAGEASVVMKECARRV